MPQASHICRLVILIAAHAASASPHEITLVEETLNTSWAERNPPPLIGDKAYDSHAHDEKFQREYGITLITPNRPNIKSCRKAQDGRVLRR